MDQLTEIIGLLFESKFGLIILLIAIFLALKLAKSAIKLVIMALLFSAAGFLLVGSNGLLIGGLAGVLITLKGAIS